MSLRALHWPKPIAKVATPPEPSPADKLRSHLVERSGAIPAVFRVTSPAYSDTRGWQFIAWDSNDMQEWANLGVDSMCQMNVAISEPWAMRGLHYQLSRPQGKLVRCIKGSIMDVALDMRLSSPTFGCHAAFELRGLQAMWCPPGFAHGYMAGPDGATVVYMFTDYHDAASERAVRWDDPALGIPWFYGNPIVSERDRAAPLFKDAETYP